MSAPVTNHSSVPAGPDAGRREWTGLAVLALASLLMSLDLSVLYLALPKMAADIDASSIQQLWIVDVYGFMTAGFLVTMGTLGDRIGRRRLLLIGTVVFGLASIGAAFSTSPEMLITARAVMGIAAATVMPSGMALIATMFKNPAQRGMAISAWMSCFMLGMLLGPVVGGVLLHFFWWGSVFLLGLPVIVLLLATAPRLLPESSSPHGGRFDLLGVVLSLGAVLGFAYGLKEIAAHGWQPVPTVCFAGGVVLGVLFVIRQRTARHPLVDLSLFRIAPFTVSLVLGLFGGAVQGGSSLLINLYLQVVHGLTPLRAGLWLLPTFLAMILGLMLGPGIAQKVKPGYVISAGLPIATIGYVVLTQLDADSGLAVLLIGYAIVLFGVGIPMGLGTGIGLSSAPPQKAGEASSITQTCNELGVALGIATLGSVGTAVYRSRLDERLPDDLPAGAAAAARSSIEGALGVAQSIGGPAGRAVLTAAREAFTAGLNTVAIIAAVTMALLAVLSAIVLRHVMPMPAPGGRGGPGGRPARGARRPADEDSGVRTGQAG